MQKLARHFLRGQLPTVGKQPSITGSRLQASIWAPRGLAVGRQAELTAETSGSVALEFVIGTVLLVKAVSAKHPRFSSKASFDPKVS